MWNTTFLVQNIFQNKTEFFLSSHIKLKKQAQVYPDILYFRNENINLVFIANVFLKILVKIL